MWKALDDAGIFGSVKVVSGLDQRSSYETLGAVATKISFLSHYFYEAPKNKANDFLVAASRRRARFPICSTRTVSSRPR